MKSYIFAKELLKMLIASHTTVKYLLTPNTIESGHELSIISKSNQI